MKTALLVLFLIFSASAGDTTAVKLDKAVRCIAKTKSGQQCKIKTKNISKICHIHTKGAKK